MYRLNKNEDGAETVAVVVTISGGSSYDTLFKEIKQESCEGEQVVTWVVTENQGIEQVLKALDDANNESDFMTDINSVEPDCVVFNFECCSACGDHSFFNSPLSMELISVLISKGFMVMVSDFSLKSLIHEWKNEHPVLGVNPFIKIGETGSPFELHFDPVTLAQCDSAQLNKVGELCAGGKANVHTLGGTICYTLNPNRIKEHAFYDLKVLTVGVKPNFCSALNCSVAEGTDAKGMCGHCILDYPSGGKLLTSATHWIELMKLDTNLESVLRVAENYGAAKFSEISQEAALCSNSAERFECVQKWSKQFVQQTQPCKFSAKSKMKMWS